MNRTGSFYKFELHMFEDIMCTTNLWQYMKCSNIPHEINAATQIEPIVGTVEERKIHLCLYNFRPEKVKFKHPKHCKTFAVD